MQPKLEATDVLEDIPQTNEELIASLTSQVNSLQQNLKYNNERLNKKERTISDLKAMLTVLTNTMAQISGAVDTASTLLNIITEGDK